MRRANHHLTDQELLMQLDDELAMGQRTSAQAHLEQCLDCQARRGRIARAAGDCSALYRSDPAESADSSGSDARTVARRAWTRSDATPSGWFGAAFGFGSVTMPRWALVGAALMATAWLIQVTAPSRLRQASGVVAVDRGALPSSTLTPGATWNVSVAELCASGTRELRPIPLAVRQQVLRNYGMENVPTDEYELDYLITPELGGAPDARNLWPQRYGSRVWNAHVKDDLERLLPRMVCDQEIRLETAQREIARDWIAAYRTYFKTDAPLQAEVKEIDRGPGQRDEDDLRYPVWRSAARRHSSSSRFRRAAERLLAPGLRAEHPRQGQLKARQLGRRQRVVGFARELLRPREHVSVASVYPHHVEIGVDYPILRNARSLVQPALDRLIALARPGGADLDDDLRRAGHVLGRHDLGRALVREIQEIGFDDVEAGEHDVVGCVVHLPDRMVFQPGANQEVQIA